MKSLGLPKVLRYMLPAFAIMLFHSFITYNPSDSSTAPGWYFVHWDAPFTDKSLVKLYGPIKQVVAREGEKVAFTPEGVYVHDKLLPNSAPEPGIPQACPYGVYTVPKDMFLGMGTNDPDSFDGRYECFQATSLIAGTVIPIWNKH